MSRAYRPASFDLPEAVSSSARAMWFRVFRCPLCQTVLGRQRIVMAYSPGERETGLNRIGHTIQRVELSRGLVPLDADDDGMLRFGLPKRAYLAPVSPPGTKRRSGLRRDTLVLLSVEGGDPYHVTRHDPRRARISD